jgi:hypothetical protein
VSNFPHAWCPNCKSRVAKPRVICNLGTTSVEILTHEWCLGTTSVEKPLPTFQLHGSIITTSFHIAELGVSVYTVLIYIWVNNPYIFQASLVAESLEHPSMVRSDWGSNPAGSHYFFSSFLLFYGAWRAWWCESTAQILSLSKVQNWPLNYDWTRFDDFNANSGQYVPRSFCAWVISSAWGPGGLWRYLKTTTN